MVFPGGEKEFAVFDPERQLKSAIGNRGTYDPNDPDLTKARGGLAVKPSKFAVKRKRN
jgi:hypothetical protein